MKKVFVTLANKEFLPYVKPLEVCARVVGKWDGDFVLIIPEEDKDASDTSELEKRGIKIYYGKKLPSNPPVHFYKMYLFHEYFKQWDWIFFCDLDVIFFDKIKFDLDNKQKDILYANVDGLSFGKQFNFDNKTHSHLLNQMVMELPLYVHSFKAFQSCFMLFNKKLIEENYYNKLLEFYKKYYSITNTSCREQSIFNLTFFKKWKPLGKKFINRYPLFDKIKWELKLLDSGYLDSTDYSDIIALHFFNFFPPWNENNLRFYPIWKKYKDYE